MDECQSGLNPQTPDNCPGPTVGHPAPFKLLKKPVMDFFSSHRRGTCPRLTPFFKQLRV
jgi:hypothetical protein